MIWLKRNFEFADYGPYFDKLESLLMANAHRYPEFLMVSVQATPPASDYYVGIPSKDFAPYFDGFEEVSEDSLPKEIDTFHIGDATKEPFTSRFTMKSARR